MGELIVPGIILIFSLVFFFAAGSLPLVKGFPMDSATYPRVLTVILMICSVFLIVRFIINHRKYIEAEKKRIFDPRIFLALGLLVLYYFSLEYLGYIFSSIVFLVILAWFLKEGKPHLLDVVILPICLPIGLFFAFNFMGIYLPAGRLFKGIF